MTVEYAVKPYKDYRRQIVELAEGQEGMTLGYLFSEFLSIQLAFLSAAGLGVWAPILAAFYFIRKYFLFNTHKPRAKGYGIAIVFSSLILFFFSWALVEKPDAEWCGIHTNSQEEKELCLQKLQ